MFGVAVVKKRRAAAWALLPNQEA